ncbi:MAG: hypothetical protein EXR93_05815 [Gemmatimonadetes bacterium]|nr:hypothetical protein [Gemmatimonadota bacterium]
MVRPGPSPSSVGAIVNNYSQGRLAIRSATAPLVLALLSCTGGDVRRPVTVTPAQFTGLRWISGSWRGTGSGVKPFFERYQFVDDSTIEMHGSPDSAFGTPGDSIRITLRGGRVVSKSASSWVATSIDSSSVRFDHSERPGNAFTFRRVSHTEWTAHIEWTGDKGVQTISYQMTRVP